jgi:Bacteriophage probable baseplate hub protein
MDLMKFRPSFKVLVDGSDITGILSDRLVSLTVTDEAGVQSDIVEIVLSDTGIFGGMAIPPKGAEIEVWLGYMFQAQYMGLFIADEVEVSGPPSQMRIRATASIHGESSSGKLALTTQRLRSWPEGTTIGGLVSAIAEEHSLEPVVSDSLASIALPHLDQVDESDISLLTRVALDYDAIAKPAAGYLAMVKRGESLTASGEPMPVVSLFRKDLTNWRLREQLRAVAGSVVATYRDVAGGADIECTAGEGDPVRRLRQRFPSQDAAQKAADSEFERAARAGRELSLSLVGDPSLVAEGRIVIGGVRSGVDGEWLVRRVVHSLESSRGYSCQIEAEALE